MWMRAKKRESGEDVREGQTNFMGLQYENAITSFNLIITGKPGENACQIMNFMSNQKNNKTTCFSYRSFETYRSTNAKSIAPVMLDVVRIKTFL